MFSFEAIKIVSYINIVQKEVNKLKKQQKFLKKIRLKSRSWGQGG